MLKCDKPESKRVLKREAGFNLFEFSMLDCFLCGRYTKKWGQSEMLLLLRLNLLKWAIWKSNWKPKGKILKCQIQVVSYQPLTKGKETSFPHSSLTFYFQQQNTIYYLLWKLRNLIRRFLKCNLVITQKKYSWSSAEFQSTPSATIYSNPSVSMHRDRNLSF